MADEFARLAADLRKIPAELRKQLRPKLRAAAEPVRADAASRASWSSRIPGAMSVHTSVTRSGVAVSIRVSAAKAPHARPFEHGGTPGSFKHPVYGNRAVWVTQAARPFLLPAAQAQSERVVRAVGDAADEAARRHGFH